MPTKTVSEIIDSCKSENSIQKICSKCKQPKPLDAFYPHPEKKFGRDSWCIQCSREAVINRRLQNIEKVRAEGREHNRKYRSKQETREKERIYARARTKETRRLERIKYRAKYPEKVRARATVHNHIKRGHLKRMPCEVCGDPKSHAHHEDYSKPLEIKWLCHKHHEEYHHGLIN